MKNYLFGLIFLLSAYCKAGNIFKNDQTTRASQPPVVKILHPTPSSIIKANDVVNIETEVSDPDGNILAVYLSVDGEILNTLNAPPYNFTWKATEGAVRFQVVAIDNDYERTISTLELNVVKPEFFVKIKNPGNGSTHKTGDVIPFEATVTSAQKVTAVDFFANDQFLSRDTTAPYTANYTCETGRALLKAEAFSAGKKTADSILIKVNDPNTNQLPVMHFANYYNGSIRLEESIVSITANASDPDGSVKMVEFFVNGSFIGSDEKAPYEVNWKARKGPAEITAIATDDKGGKSISAESYNLYIENKPSDRKLVIVQPANGSVYKAGSKVRIEAYHSCLESYSTYTRSRVQFWVNGMNLGTDFDYPYRVDWNAQKGKAVIKAIAHDNFDEVIDSVTIEIDDSNNNINPVVNLIRPEIGSIVDPGKLLTLEAKASDADGSVSHVSFFANEALVGTDSTAPYIFNWTALNGTTEIKVVAQDNKGSLAADSTLIQVISNVAPVIKLTTPADSTVLVSSSSVFIQASASDAVGEIAKAAFYINNKLIGTFLEPPYKRVAEVEKGTSVIKAVVTDDKGLTGTDSLFVFYNPLPDPFEIKIKTPTHFSSTTLGKPVNLFAEVTTVPPAKVDFVEFRLNDSIFLYDSVAPYSVNWTPAMQGFVKLYAFAYGESHTAIDADTFYVKKSDFEVKLIEPNPNTLGSNRLITIEAAASDSDHKIKKVEFFVEGTFIGTDTTLPYTAGWIGKRGKTIIHAIATNELGNTVQDTMYVEIEGDYLLVKLISPENGQEYNAGDNISINARLEEFKVVDYHINNVEFFVNDVSIGIDSKVSKFQPYRKTWVTKKGYALIKAVAWRESTRYVVDSVFIKVNDTVTNIAPVVTITTPVNASTYKPGEKITINATASDPDGTIKFVSFFIDGNFIGNDSIAPYSIGWTTGAPGKVKITAKATDNLTAIGASAPVEIIIESPSELKPVEEENKILIYPNPASDVLMIESDENATVQLLAVDGKTVVLQTQVLGNQKQSWNIGKAAAGSYVVKVYNEHFVSFRKIIISR